MGKRRSNARARQGGKKGAKQDAEEEAEPLAEEGAQHEAPERGRPRGQPQAPRKAPQGTRRGPPRGAKGSKPEAEQPVQPPPPKEPILPFFFSSSKLVRSYQDLMVPVKKRKRKLNEGKSLSGEDADDPFHTVSKLPKKSVHQMLSDARDQPPRYPVKKRILDKWQRTRYPPMKKRILDMWQCTRYRPMKKRILDKWLPGRPARFARAARQPPIKKKILDKWQSSERIRPCVSPKASETSEDYYAKYAALKRQLKFGISRITNIDCSPVTRRKKKKKKRTKKTLENSHPDDSYRSQGLRKKKKKKKGHESDMSRDEYYLEQTVQHSDGYHSTIPKGTSGQGSSQRNRVKRLIFIAKIKKKKRLQPYKVSILDQSQSELHSDNMHTQTDVEISNIATGKRKKKDMCEDLQYAKNETVECSELDEPSVTDNKRKKKQESDTNDEEFCQEESVQHAECNDSTVAKETTVSDTGGLTCTLEETLNQMEHLLCKLKMTVKSHPGLNHSSITESKLENIENLCPHKDGTLDLRSPTVTLSTKKMGEKNEEEKENKMDEKKQKNLEEEEEEEVNKKVIELEKGNVKEIEREEGNKGLKERKTKKKKKKYSDSREYCQEQTLQDSVCDDSNIRNKIPESDPGCSQEKNLDETELVVKTLKLTIRKRTDQNDKFYILHEGMQNLTFTEKRDTPTDSELNEQFSSKGNKTFGNREEEEKVQNETFDISGPDNTSTPQGNYKKSHPADEYSEFDDSTTRIRQNEKYLLDRIEHNQTCTEDKDNRIVDESVPSEIPEEQDKKKETDLLLNRTENENVTVEAEHRGEIEHLLEVSESIEESVKEMESKTPDEETVRETSESIEESVKEVDSNIPDEEAVRETSESIEEPVIKKSNAQGEETIQEIPKSIMKPVKENKLKTRGEEKVGNISKLIKKIAIAKKLKTWEKVKAREYSDSDSTVVTVRSTSEEEKKTPLPIRDYDFEDESLLELTNTVARLDVSVIDLGSDSEHSSGIKNTSAPTASTSAASTPSKLCSVEHNESFGLEYQLKGHRSAIKKYFCEVCDKQFSSKGVLSLHLKTHEVLDFKCAVCGQTFLFKKNLDLHSAMHSDETLFKCNICRKSFILEISLERHKATTHAEKFDCVSCDVKFSNAKELSAHLVVHNKKLHDDGDTKDLSARSKEQHDEGDVKHLSAHSATTDLRGEDAKGLSAPSEVHTEELRDETELFKCNICDEVFNSEPSLRDHVISHKKEKFECEKCEKRFSSARTLKRHAKVHEQKKRLTAHSVVHTEELSVEEEAKDLSALSVAQTKELREETELFKCKICDEVFNSEPSLHDHGISHEKQKFECENCEKRFSSAHTLKRHAKVHEQKKRLSAHSVVHTEELSVEEEANDLSALSVAQTKELREETELFKCKICDEVFNSEPSLHDHGISHEKQKFECENCEKRFSSAHTLKRHAKVHEQKKRLSAHSVVHTEELSVEEEAKDLSALSVAQTKKLREETELFKCNICDEVFNSEPSLHDHVISHKKEKFECEKCEKRFSSARTLKRHAKVHEQKKRLSALSVAQTKELRDETELFKCNICDEVFNSEPSLHDHVICHEKHKFECEKCGKRFSLARTLKQHASVHKQEEDLSGHSVVLTKELSDDTKDLSAHSVSKEGDTKDLSADEDEVFKCKTCHKSFYCERTLRYHLFSHETDEFECYKCEMTFPSARTLKEHVSVHKQKKHLSAHSVTKKLSDEDEVFKCEICDTKFDSKRTFKQHLSTHKKDKFECDECEKTFSSPRTLKQHASLHKQTKLFKCTVCDKEYMTLRYLSYHEESHKRLKHECEVCHEKFSRRIHLKAHSVIHSEAERFKCDLCDKEFKSRTALSGHIVTHAEKKYECEHCLREFSHPVHLDQHLVVHTGEKSCVICRKVFPSIKILNRHMVSHGERQLECQHCDKKFHHPDTLRLHMVVHSEDRPYKCDLCEMAFKRRNELKMHKERHLKIINNKQESGHLKKADPPNEGTVQSPIKIGSMGYIKCPVLKCKRTFFFPEALKLHFQTAHLQQVQDALHKIDLRQMLAENSDDEVMEIQQSNEDSLTSDDDGVHGKNKENKFEEELEPPLYQCTGCSRMYRGNSKLTCHLCNFHNKKQKLYFPYNSKSKRGVSLSLSISTPFNDNANILDEDG